MLHQRLVALCTGLAMLHLTSVGTDLTCTAHAGGKPHELHESRETHAGMLMPRDGDGAVQDHAAQQQLPPYAPPRTECCQGLSSCSTTAVISAAAASPESLELHQRVVGNLIAAPSSLTVAPEPPPPKA